MDDGLMSQTAHAIPGFTFQTATHSRVVARRLSPTRSGMTGQYSIPETLVLKRIGRGVLDAPHEAGHDSGETHPRVLAARCVRGLHQNCPSRIKREQGRPGARPHPWSACNKKHAAEPQV